MKLQFKLIALMLIIFTNANLFSYENIIWIPCTGKGTVVAVDAESYDVLGEYYTLPLDIRSYASPSRYAINYNNDVIFGHRNIAALSIIHYKNPANFNTSTGLGDIKPWGNSGPEDEAIVKTVVLPRLSDTRHVSVTVDKKIIVSGRFNPDFFYVLDGTTYEIIDSIVGTCAGGYGGQVQKNMLWSVSKDLGKTMRYNLETQEQVCFNIDTSYGICGLPSGSVFNTRLKGNRVYKLTPEMTVADTGFNVGKSCRGVSYNPHNNRIYIANSLEDYVTEMDTLGNITDAINLRLALNVKPPNVVLDATGIIANGKDIIITCNAQDTAIVYDTESNTYVQLIDLGVGALPYFYSSTTNLSFLFPEIDVPDTLEFARELCEDERSDFLTITNTGFADLTLDSFKLTGYYAGWFKIATQFPLTIPSKESRNITVWSNRPDTNGIITANLKLYSDAINSQQDKSISVVLKAEYQTMRHIVEGVTGDTIYLGRFLSSSVKDTNIRIKNISTVNSELLVRVKNSGIFRLMSDSVLNLAHNGTSLVRVRFAPTSNHDGMQYATLEMENECRIIKLILKAEIACKPAIIADDTIYACGPGDIIKLSRFIDIIPVQGAVDSAYAKGSDGNTYQLDQEIKVMYGLDLTIYAWSNGCMSQKKIVLYVPEIDYDEEEDRLVIPRNPISIGPSANFNKLFKGLNIMYFWTPNKWIVSDDLNQRIMAVDPDSNITYRLQILVEERCTFNYRCNVTVSPCDVEEGSIGNYVNIYPNPANEVVYLNLPMNIYSVNSNLVITNTLGLEIYKSSLVNGEQIYMIDSKDFPQGSYSVRLMNGHKNYQIGSFIIYR